MLPMLAVSVVGLVVIIGFLGLLCWLAYKSPIPAGFKTAIYVVLIIIVILLALDAFGILGQVRSIQVPHV